MAKTDIYLAPMMTGVPAVACEIEQALDVMRGTGAMVIGGTHVPGSGPALALGVKRPDGTGLIAITSIEHAAQLHENLGEALAAIRTGAFDLPASAQA